LDIAQGEKVEGELDTFIERRESQRRKAEGERAVEELWRASERRHQAQRREENRAAWCEYHRAAAESARATLEALIARHAPHKNLENRRLVSGHLQRN